MRRVLNIFSRLVMVTVVMAVVIASAAITMVRWLGSFGCTLLILRIVSYRESVHASDH